MIRDLARLSIVRDARGRVELRGVDLEGPGASGEKYDAARVALDEAVGSLRWQARVRAVLLAAIERGDANASKGAE